jgi:hypothetical protein
LLWAGAGKQASINRNIHAQNRPEGGLRIMLEMPAEQAVWMILSAQFMPLVLNMSDVALQAIFLR